MTTIVTNGEIVLVDRFASAENGNDFVLNSFVNKFREIKNGKVMKEHHNLDFEPTMAFITGSLGEAHARINFLEEQHQDFSLRMLSVFGTSDENIYDILLTGKAGNVILMNDKNHESIGSYLQSHPQVFGSGSCFKQESCFDFTASSEEELLDLFLMSVYFDPSSSYEYNKVTLGTKPKIEYFNPSEERIKQAFCRFYNPVFYRQRPKIRESL